MASSTFNEINTTPNLTNEDKALNTEFILNHGTYLGRGSFGSVYKIGPWVYKIYYPHISEDEVERAIRYWNETYSKIYNGYYSDLPKATFTYDGKNYVGRSPFIEGEDLDESGFFTPCCPYSAFIYTEDQKLFDNELKQIGLGMYDIYIRTNIKKTKMGHLLPVDFDAFFKRPLEIDTFTAVYDKDDPPSPTSFTWANRSRLFKTVTITATEIAKLKKQKASVEGADILGGRSMYFRSF